jgi:histidinol dehydrogenase
LKTQQVVEYDEAGLQAISDMIVTLAKAENLPAHGDAVLERFAETTEL